MKKPDDIWMKSIALQRYGMAILIRSIERPMSRLHVMQVVCFSPLFHYRQVQAQFKVQQAHTDGDGVAGGCTAFTDSWFGSADVQGEEVTLGIGWCD